MQLDDIIRNRLPAFLEAVYVKHLCALCFNCKLIIICVGKI